MFLKFIEGCIPDSKQRVNRSNVFEAVGMNISIMRINHGRLTQQHPVSRGPCDFEQSAFVQGWARYACVHMLSRNLFPSDSSCRNSKGSCDHESVIWISRRLKTLDLNMQEMALACEGLQLQQLPHQLKQCLSVCLRVSLAAVNVGYSFRQHAPWQLLLGGDSHLVRVYLRSATSLANMLAWVREQVNERLEITHELEQIDQVRSVVRLEIHDWTAVFRRLDECAHDDSQSGSHIHISSIDPKVRWSALNRALHQDSNGCLLNDRGYLPEKPTGSASVRQTPSALERSIAVHRFHVSAHSARS